MPRRRYLYSTPAPRDNTAQIGLQQRNRAEIYANNFYYDALKKVRNGSTNPYYKGIVDARNPNSLYSKMKRSSGRLERTYPEFDLMTLLPMGAKAISRIPWTYNIPKNPKMAYRIMGPLEKDWIMKGNELSTRATNALTTVEENAARAKAGRFNLFKAGAEHGGRKQFSKGQPWGGTTVTHGERQVLAIPGENLPWVSGRHYKGPQGNSFGAGAILFEDAPIGSHIDLLTKNGYSGINPSLMKGSVIYSPFKVFGRKFGYKKLYPNKVSQRR